MAKMMKTTTISRTWLLLFLAILLIAQPFTKAMAVADSKPAEKHVDSDSDSDSDDEDGAEVEAEPITEAEAGESSLAENYEEGGEGEGDEDGGEGDAGGMAPEEDAGEVEVDESDVVVLTNETFQDTISKNEFVMVEFYAPWCGHCKTLKPEYAKAATALKAYDEKIVLAKVDATQEDELTRSNGVEGFPTLYWFHNGVKKTFSGGRRAEDLVNWVKKRTGPAALVLSSAEETEKFLETNPESAIGFFEAFEGKEWEHFQQLAKNEDYLAFAQTTCPEAAAAAGIKGNPPALVIVKTADDEKFIPFEGEFSFEVLSKFAAGNKLSTVTVFSSASAERIFGSPIQRQLLFFVPESKTDVYLPIYHQACSKLKGDVICVHVKSSIDESQQVYEFFGIDHEAVEIYGYTTMEESKKFHFGQEMTVDNIVAWATEFAAGNIQATFKSEEVPETNDEDVKVVVGKSFDDIVLDETKDVLLEAYAPWCGHCQQLEPTYKKLAKKFRSVPSVVIAKIDATLNEHPRLEAQGFPTILFFPAGKKDEEPITVDGDRSLKTLTKFIKDNAAIPFTLEKKKKKTATEEEVVVDAEPEAVEELTELQKDEIEAAHEEEAAKVEETAKQPHSEL